MANSIELKKLVICPDCDNIYIHDQFKNGCPRCTNKSFLWISKFLKSLNNGDPSENVMLKN